MGFLAGGGEMGARIRAFDWSRHPLGPAESWPRPLRVALRLILNTGHPMYVWWGPDLYCFYNDAYRELIGPERHPSSLGRRGREVWEEIWPIIGPQVEQAASGGGSVWSVNALIPITRRGRCDDAYWTYSFSPIDDDDAPNGVGGVLVVCTETTAEVVAKRRLAMESERLRRLFEQAPGFIIVTRGPEHKVEFVNEEHRRLFNSGDWIGRPIREVFTSAESQRFSELLQGVYTTGKTYEASNAKVRYRRFPGGPQETRYITFTLAPWFEDGRITGVFGDGFDVTEVRRTELALRESDERRRLATEAGEIGTYDYDPVSGEVRWDARCKELFGLPPDAEVSFEGTFLRGVHPDDRERTKEAVKAALEPGGSGDYEAEYRTIGIEDGVERWLASKGQTVFRHGRATRFIGTVRDITQRKLATHRLEIVNRTALAIAAELDFAKIAQIVAEAGVELTGAQFGVFLYSVPDSSAGGMLTAVAGVRSAELDDLSSLRKIEVFSRLFEGPGVVRSDDMTKDRRFGANALRGRAPEGLPPIRSYLAIPVVSPHGDVRGGLLFGHSEAGVFKSEHESLLLGVAGQTATAIDNARLVEALQALNASLEQRVAAEVAERLEAEQLLRQAQKLEAVGQLTGGVAHDFNNLLMVVSAGLNMIEQSDDQEHKEYLLARMREAVRRGAALTDQLLAFSRKRESKPEIVSSGDLRRMSSLLSRGLGAHVRVETDIEEGLEAICVDPTALQLAILNLAVNARDAMPAGGTITIRCRNGTPDSPGASCVSISVIDEGVGMTAETKDRMFEPFFTTKEIGKGSGLGLAQVRTFAQQSGGRVEVDTQPGRGTAVTLVLPRSTNEAAVVEGPAATDYDAPPMDAGRALLVEDDDEVAAMTVAMLEQLGWSVSRAQSAEAALALLAKNGDVDLVFSDVMMPGGMSGFDLAAVLRAKTPRVPILLTTGLVADAKERAESADLPLIPKPFTLETLAAAIYLARRRTGERGRDPPTPQDAEGRPSQPRRVGASAGRQP